MLFALLFVAVQAATLVHQLDPDAHEGGSACDICLAASTLGGMDSASPSLDEPVLIALVEEFAAVSVSVSVFRKPFQPRAPPLAS